MPAIVLGDTNFKGSSFRPQQDYAYEYPDNLNLRPGSSLHDSIRDKVLERAYHSARYMSGRHADWNKIDHTLTAYIPVDDKERLLKNEDSRKPISVVFPYSYTILETLLSYYVSAFLRDPIFRYAGTTPDSVIGSILLEKIINIQAIKTKVGLALHTQARDAFAYGFGVATPTWVTNYGPKRVVTKSKGFFGYTKESVTLADNQLVFEGNGLDNIDPYLYLPDTSVPITTPQKGEYVIWGAFNNYNSLLGEEINDAAMFNVKYLRELLGRTSSIFSRDASGRNTKSGMSQNSTFTNSTTQNITLLKAFIRLIPKEWGLGDSEYPEIWYFELGQDSVIIKAHPSKLSHGKFPVSVIAPDDDGYSVTPISKIEMLYGMQGILDFMFNSHVANVRKAINDMIIYDPYMVNSADLKNPAPGKLIRLRRPAWGRGVSDVAKQLTVSDVTRGNVSDSTWIVQWMDRISGADSSMQGALRTSGPERLTGAEFQGTRAGGMGRMERMAKIIGMQGMQDVGEFFAAHTTQMMQNDSYIKIVGDWRDVLLKEYGKTVDRGMIKVSPADINVNYEVVIKDGTVPGGNYSDAWLQLFNILGQNPELAQKFDMVRVFTHIARNLGAKNVNDFIKQTNDTNPISMPNEQVNQQVQAGNLVPLGGER